MVREETVENFGFLDSSTKIAWEESPEQRPMEEAERISELIAREGEYRPSPYLFQKQPEVSPVMRTILLDWMMEVCHEFCLKRETYYIA
jgi:hypothetical protein